MLEHDAIRFYYDKLPILADYPVLIADHYYLMIKRSGILFHSQSVVTFCHRFDPERFSNLTRNRMREAFPRHELVYGKGLCAVFRVMAEQEFKEIIS